MNPWGLWDLDPLGNHKHLCASRTGVYIGFRGALNLVDPSDSLYNLYLYILHTYIIHTLYVLCMCVYIHTHVQGTKSSLECKQMHAGMNTQKPTKQGGNDTTILSHIPTSSAIFWNDRQKGRPRWICMPVMEQKHWTLLFTCQSVKLCTKELHCFSLNCVAVYNWRYNTDCGNIQLSATMHYS